MTQRSAFNDHFSDGSAEYAENRPGYPDVLYRFLAEQCANQRLALDCATGNGQAAIGLSAYFDHIIATDASEEQIAAAISNPKIDYRVATAEHSGLAANSVDLITVAQALHWFDQARFFAEAERVLHPGGLLASWCYAICRVSDDCDALVMRLYEDLVGSYWPVERHYIDSRYATIAFPRPRLAAPEFEMRVDWSVQRMLGYLRTWSACKRYIDERGEDPVSIIEPELTKAWGGVRPVSWPVTVVACRF